VDSYDESAFELDIKRWISLFPLARIRAEHKGKWGPDQGEFITSPYDLAVVEQLRDEVAAVADLGPSVPTDVFTFCLGEPERRDVTKIGGLPYRPLEKPWPMTSDGVPFTFIAQFNFSDSHDLIGETPAEILLLFARDEMMLNNDPESLLWEWQPPIFERLVTKEQIPPPAWQFVTCYGVRHRSIDYVDETDVFEQHKIRRDWEVARFHGTKIGGLPGAVFRYFEYVRGKLLCTLGSIQYEPDRPYPFVNHPAPLSLSDLHRPDLTLIWGDLGIICIFIDDRGQLTWLVYW
jgi:hypothetical protein